MPLLAYYAEREKLVAVNGGRPGRRGHLVDRGAATAREAQAPRRLARRRPGTCPRPPAPPARPASSGPASIVTRHPAAGHLDRHGAVPPSSSTAATAHAPVPQDSVSPEPRSYTRIRPPVASPATTSTFTPVREQRRVVAGRLAQVDRGHVGHPADQVRVADVDRRPGDGRAHRSGPLLLPVRSGVGAWRPRRPARRRRPATTPARVPNSSAAPATSPASTRYRANTRAPLPHISARLPSELR